MSTSVSVAIASRLNGTEALTGQAQAAQTALVGMLSKLPTSAGAKPAVVFGNKTDYPNLAPIITSRPLLGTPDGRFADGQAMDDTIYALELWDNSRSGTLLTDMGEYVEQLLDMRRQIAPPLPLARGVSYWSELSRMGGLLYDEKLNAWSLLLLYRVKEARF